MGLWLGLLAWPTGLALEKSEKPNKIGSVKKACTGEKNYARTKKLVTKGKIRIFIFVMMLLIKERMNGGRESELHKYVRAHSYIHDVKGWEVGIFFFLYC